MRNEIFLDALGFHLYSEFKQKFKSSVPFTKFKDKLIKQLVIILQLWEVAVLSKSINDDLTNFSEAHVGRSNYRLFC